MPSPFPGMDPYLERPHLWSDVHPTLISAVRVALVPHVAPRYYVAVELRAYVAPVENSESHRRPDIAVVREAAATFVSESAVAVQEPPMVVRLPQLDEERERYVEIRDVKTHEVITAIELLSPTNKRSGIGRSKYFEKRIQVLDSRTHLVEIDLLRGGEPMPTDPAPRMHYRILVSRVWERPKALLYPFNLNQRIPEIPIPLRRGEPEPTIALGALLAQIYDAARYDLRIDYTSEPEPPLDPATATWAHNLLHRAAQP